MRARSTEYEELATESLKEFRAATYDDIREYALQRVLVYSNLAIAAATEENYKWRDR